MTERLLLLDTASLYFRAYFGSPEILAPDGTNVNAVRGLLGYISQLVDQYRPTHLVCCWDDDWRPQWRVDLIPTYKAHRVVEEVTGAAVAGPGGVGSGRRYVEEVPDPLEIQVPVIREVLDAFGIAVVGAPGYEADDVIGTLATGAGMPVDVVTGDRDLFQLVDDAASVRVLYVGKGVGRHERVDEAWVLSKYGVRADQYADFATLRGDASDGLPGVKGVGEKTAASMLQKYDDLAGILAAVDDPASDLGPGPRAKIRDAGAYLAVAPRVVAVARDLDLSRDHHALPASPAAPDELAALVERWSLASPVERLTGVLAATAV
ncbi:5'-3' exonuclease H3TH domain-containing protein [Nocardioides kongjuensis]|uniref:5'-3' exonuclease n=1 Tax=Nocardioides kongjuensis TaxID=349522 RepID=A0A852RT56_9ACTN|nr:5'-3' exonuclease [Nocardioides kongjuensis]NYD29772.1 5'-3' exonuclease [Nocardioides kongjuensis]